MKILAISLLLFAATALADTLTDCDLEVAKLAWLVKADPVKDANTAINIGNRKYKAIYGFSLIFPCIEEDAGVNPYKTGAYEAIEGTSDNLCSEEHMRLNILAEEYACVYNKTILNAK